jgi:hypothetical protein
MEIESLGRNSIYIILPSWLVLIRIMLDLIADCITQLKEKINYQLLATYDQVYNSNDIQYLDDYDDQLTR